MRNFKARFSAWPDCFKCGIVVVEGSIVDIFLQIMHSILLRHLTSGFRKPTRIWARCHFDFGFSLSGPPSCCLAFWLPFLFSFQSFATVLPVGHFNCGIQFEALYVPSANYTKIKGPFLGANFNSQLPNGHLAIGHWSTASWNAFCNLWFVSQANWLHFKIPIWWHAISIEGLTSSDMICPAWDLLIQHLQVSSRLAEAFLFQVHLWNPVWSMPALGPWHWVAWGKAATTAESWEPKKIAIGYWIKMFLIVVAICRIISFDGFSGEEQSGENRFPKLPRFSWKFLEILGNIHLK